MSGSSIRVIVLAGELDIGRRAEVATALAVAPGDRALLVDLSAVTYADSTALAALLALRSAALGAGVALALLVTSRQLTRLMQYAGIGHAMRVFADRGEALRALSEP